MAFSTKDFKAEKCFNVNICLQPEQRSIYQESVHMFYVWEIMLQLSRLQLTLSLSLSASHF